MLVNARTGDAVASAVELADTRAARRKGLLGRESLPSSSALLISPCFAIHTIGMKFPIDVLFVDREGVIVRIVRELPPARIAIAIRSRAVVELAAGALRDRDVQIGDRIYLSAS